VPKALRDLAFATIGVSLGAGVGPGIVQDLARWSASLAALGLVVVATMAVSTRLLVQGGMERGAALLATSPGALSAALILAEETGRDVRTISLLQATRLLVVTAALPPALALGGSPGIGTAAATGDTGYAAGAALLAVAFLAGHAGAR
jgi:uncharacterized membrane protein AbrB (regulator of aidB expression)